nr:hypothetical protein [Tanacetum cinerariifolium]
MLVIKIFSERKKVFRERKKCEKIHAKRKYDDLIIDGQAILIDEDGNPFKKVEYPGDHDSEYEVALVDNDMARSIASDLLEEWRDSYGNVNYDDDPYDDDMYEGQCLPGEL